jgi:protein-L-isoaspartate(D-aspartate) O-methyltransferase
MPKAPPDFDALREQMVQQQLMRRNIKDGAVLDAMRRVPRHLFVDEGSRHMAYWDGPLSIGEGQTISQPYIVAFMTQLLRLQGHEKVLEVGCGSGYQAAVLSCLAHRVITIERHELLAKEARERLHRLGYANVTVVVGDGTLGVPPEAPFDAILITASAPALPPPLKDQLALGGRMVGPVGSVGTQVLEVLERWADGWRHQHSIPVMFVPLIGAHGWEEGAWSRDSWWV